MDGARPARRDTFISNKSKRLFSATLFAGRGIPSAEKHVNPDDLARSRSAAEHADETGRKERSGKRQPRDRKRQTQWQRWNSKKPDFRSLSTGRTILMLVHRFVQLKFEQVLDKVSRVVARFLLVFRKNFCQIFGYRASTTGNGDSFGIERNWKRRSVRDVANAKILPFGRHFSQREMIRSRVN